MTEPQMRSRRDPRLDFFRGLAMFIIFIAHVPDNAWQRWIPARFGLSDATEIFVFCSGMAAAIAFGGTFRLHGFLMGTRRILFRCWQIYWAHLSLFFILATLCALVTTWTVEPNYIIKLNLIYFFENTGSALAGLFSLTYVPNYFDILPMYMVLLLMTPLVIALHRLHLGLAIGFCLLLYASVWLRTLAGCPAESEAALCGFHLNPPAEPWTDRRWFFNPFAWQIIFFTGFMIGAKWVRVPRPHPALFTLAALFVLVSIPWRHWDVYLLVFDEAGIDWWLRGLLFMDGFKTDFSLLRWLHFVAMAYVAYCLLWGREQVLLSAPLRPIVLVGQFALAAFLTSMTLSWVGGMVLDQIGRGFWALAAVNLSGFVLLVAVAAITRWYRGQPWRKPPAGGWPARAAVT